MVRREISELVKMGPFPLSSKANPALIKRQQEILTAIILPISDEEARELVHLFGPDDYYGLAWTVLHLVETSPQWPLEEYLGDTANDWINRLKSRAARKG